MAYPWRKRIREGIPRWTGIHVYRTLPQGVSLFYDLARALPTYSPKLIFDVGANVGQSTDEFLVNYPGARVYSFEPASLTFTRLLANVGNRSNVHCFPLAFSDKEARAKLSLNDESVLNRLVTEDSQVSQDPENAEVVHVTTITQFCLEQGIDRIDLLKVDTEGEDLNVLKGADNLLEEGRIGIIQVETGMNPTNQRHVPFQQLKDYLESRGYCLFGIYEQFLEVDIDKPMLRRVNPVFFNVRSIEVLDPILESSSTASCGQE